MNKTPDSKGWYTAGPLARLRDAVPMKPSPHWSFDPKADKKNRRLNRKVQSVHESLNELNELLRKLGNVGK